MLGKGRCTILVALAICAALVAIPRTPGQAATVRAGKTGALVKALRTGALATFDVSGERFRVWVTNSQTIEQLQALEAGTGTAHIPNGRILRGPGKAGFNKPWHWHLDPQDIEMADFTMELCDGAPTYVEQNVGEFVDTVKRYCPWNAQLVSLQILTGKPATPRRLRAILVGSAATNARPTTVRLTWSDRSKNEAGFRIRATFTRRYGGSDGQTWAAPADSHSATVTFVAGGINPVRTACFTVTAFNAASETRKSNRACVKL
jgi:hypothetical protein